MNDTNNIYQKIEINKTKNQRMKFTEEDNSEADTNAKINDNNKFNASYTNSQNVNFSYIKNDPKNLTNESIPPPNPLIQRTKIPEVVPRIGNLKKFLKLPNFNKNQEIIKLEMKPLPLVKYIIYNISNNKDENNINPNKLYEEKLIELRSYINSIQMKKKLIYYKLGKEGNIETDNFINLNKSFQNDEIKSFIYLEPFYNLKGKNDNTLIFESRFESGNLLCAFKDEEDEKLNTSKYQLVLQNDTNTRGYIQWFFFRISNIKKGHKVNFNIINMVRKKSLYSQNIKIICYSTKKAEKEKIGFHRAGTNINYVRNNLYIFNQDYRRDLYTLTFDYEFKYDNDTIYFSNCYPYLYGELVEQLNYYELNEAKYPFFHRRSLCNTLGGNRFELVTINSTYESYTIKPRKKNHKSKCLNINFSNININKVQENKKCVILLARVHPGETVSSYIIKGAMDFLMGNSEEAKRLRELYVFKIIPMLNPDGVLAGNSRASFAGCDLNRRWSNPDEHLHPEIYSAKNMILSTFNQMGIDFICDFHGHIGAFNSFFYCNHKENKRSCSLFPYICSQINSIINYFQCNFRMPKYKSSTCRISLFKELNLNNIVTLETSFFGTSKYQKIEGCNRVYYTCDILQNIGRDVCLGILAYYYKYENKSIEKKLIDNNKTINVDMNKFEELINNEGGNKKDKDNKDNMDDNLIGEDDDNIEDSESEPSVDNYEENILNDLLPYRKNKKHKSSSKIKKKMNFQIKKLSKNDLLFTESSKKNDQKSSFSIPKPKIAINCLNFHNKINQEDKNKNTFNKVSVSLIAKIQLKNEYTQTEEIFFKMHWSYFSNDYVIMESKIVSKRVVSSRIRNISNSENNNNSITNCLNNISIISNVKPFISNKSDSDLRVVNYPKQQNIFVNPNLNAKRYSPFFMNFLNNGNNILNNIFSKSNKHKEIGFNFDKALRNNPSNYFSNKILLQNQSDQNRKKCYYERNNNKVSISSKHSQLINNKLIIAQNNLSLKEMPFLKKKFSLV